MAKQSYTQTVIEINSRLSVLETHIPHIENHLGNINGQLEKQNTRIQKNSQKIARIYGIGAGLMVAVVAGILKLVGVY